MQPGSSPSPSEAKLSFVRNRNKVNFMQSETQRVSDCKRSSFCRMLSL